MGRLDGLEEKINQMGGVLKVTGSEVIGTFYHRTLSESELSALAQMIGLTGLAFYMSGISDQDVHELSRTKGIQKIGFFSCQYVSEGVLDYLENFESLKLVSFVDTSVPNDKLLAYRELHPEIQIAGVVEK